MNPGVTAVLNNLVISNGYTQANGGGIYNRGTLAVSDSTLSGNSATGGFGGGDSGGGIYNDYSATLTVSNSTLSGNSTAGWASRQGGGIYNQGVLTVSNSTLSGNSTTGPGGSYNGGGICNDYSGVLTVSNSTLSGNSTTGSGGSYNGGGIVNLDVLTVSNSTLSGNSATGGPFQGGGILNVGTRGRLTVNNSTVSGNTANEQCGGGISNYLGVVTVSNSTLSGNTASPGGNSAAGGVYNYFGTVTVDNSTVSGNTVRNGGDWVGGGIGNSHGTATVNNSTVSDNAVLYGAFDSGGGIFNGFSATLTISNSTLSGNSAQGSEQRGGGGGIYNDYLSVLTVANSTISGNSDGGIFNSSGATANLENTIVAGNNFANSAFDLSGNFNLDHSLIQDVNGFTDTDSGSNLFGVDPLLDPLGDYGGPTQSMALLPGSPAIDAGSNALAVDANGEPLTTDQRGLPRTVNGTVDIGAFESSGFTLTATGGNGQSTPVGLPFNSPLAVTVTANNAAEPVDGGQVTFSAPAAAPTATLSNQGVATITGGQASVTAQADTTPGSYSVRAAATGAANTSFSLTNLERNQTINFGDVADQTYGNGPLTLAATATSGLPVTLIVLSGPVTLAGNTLTLTGAGTVTVEATQGGNWQYFAASAVDCCFNVGKANQTIAWSNPADIVYGTALSSTQFNAKVTGTGPAATGGVTYGPAAGVILDAGAHQALTVNVAGTADYNPASATVYVNVTQATPGTSLVSSVSPSGLGQSVTFTATVTVVGSGRTPTGTMTFKDGNTVLGSFALTAGQATFRTSNLALGNHSITACYGGNGDYKPSAGALTQTVKRVPTAAVLSSANTAVFGKKVTFTAYITPGASGGSGPAVPTGSVIFQDNGVPVATVNLVNGIAAYSTTALTPGSHTITACWSGDACYIGCTAAYTLTVSKANTSVAIASATNPAVVGQTVKLTATVAAVSPGSGTPSGTVTFKEGTTILGTGILDATGKAVCSVFWSHAGNHSIVAVYGGDGNFNCSTSGNFAETVNRAATTVRLVASPNPPALGQTVTFTATVATVPSGNVTPSGTVLFEENGVVRGSALLDVTGKAVWSTSTLGLGSHIFTVVYVATVDFIGSSGQTTLKIS